ncbi:VWA domain-containing protein, partial [Alkaliphilus peptidifermentans]
MKGKVKKSIVLIMVLALIFNGFAVTYAGTVPSNLDDDNEEWVDTQTQDEFNSGEEDNDGEDTDKPEDLVGEEENSEDPTDTDGEDENSEDPADTDGEDENSEDPADTDGEDENSEDPADTDGEEENSEDPTDTDEEEEISEDPTDLEEVEEELGTGTGTGTGTGIVVPVPVYERPYVINYLVEATEDSVPGLESLYGFGQVGDTIEVLYPEIEGYFVLENQPVSFVIVEEEEFNIINVYYGKVIVIYEKASLTVNHILVSEGGEVLIDTTLLEGLEIGAHVNLLDFAKEDDTMELLYDNLEEIFLTEEENLVNLYYQKKPGNEQFYVINYLVESTEDSVPGLDSISGFGEVGDTIEILYPEREGYFVLENQPVSFVIVEEEEFNIINVYYGKVTVIYEKASLTVNHILVSEGGEVLIDTTLLEGLEIGAHVNPLNFVKEDDTMELLYDSLEEIFLSEEENLINLYYYEKPVAQDFYYPIMPMMMRFSTLSYGTEWPNPGAIKLTKEAEPVQDSENSWEVTLTIEGKNIQSSSKVVLVIDKSGSMGPGYGSGDRMVNTKLAAKEFVDRLLLDDGATEIAVVTFDQNPQVVANFTSFEDKDTLKAAIDGIQADGGTNIQAGIRQAQILLDAVDADNKVMVILGDGEPTYSYRVTGVSGITLTCSFWSGHTFNYDNAEITSFNYNQIRGNGRDYSLPSNHRYSVTIPCSTWGHGSHTTTYPNDNGIPTIYEAGLAKDKGTDIYSIALEADANGQAVLNSIQNKGYYQLNNSNLSGLEAVFNEIAGSITYAASNGIVVDPMGTMFDLISSEAEIYVSQGSVTINPANTVNWNVGNVAEGTPAILTYIVQIKSDADANVMYPTNDTTTFTYTDVDGNTVEDEFDIPEVSIAGGRILLKGYLVNDNGDPINKNGVVVDRPDLAYKLFDKEYPGSPLGFNEVYTVTQPGAEGYHYLKYVWNNSTGSDETVSVLLQASKPTEIVWFGYREVAELEYTVEYYINGQGEPFATIAGEVPVANPVVGSVSYENKPAGYK